MIEIYNMEIDRYRLADGRPTCALSFPDRQVCVFHTTSVFGTRDSCYWLYGELLNNYDECGFMKPDNRCPIWNQTKQITRED